MSFWNAIGAGISGLFGLGSSALSMGMSYGQTKELQQRQFDYQERMSNTAYQRATEDMRKAGLNPKMAGMSQTGASTPSGASGQGANVNLGEGLINGISTAAQVQNTKANTELQNEQAKTEETKRQNFEANTALQKLQGIGENIKNMYRYEGQNVDSTEETYFEMSTATKAQLNSADFYKNSLKWSDEIWDLSELNFDKGALPKLRQEK